VPTSSVRRGRPAGSDGATTRERLVEAAHAACLDVGLDAVTLADICGRAGVTPAAVYNHFEGKGELLFEAGRRALEALTAGAVGSLDEVRSAREIAAGYLAPELSAQRRLLLQIHQASERDADLRAVLAAWHRQSSEQLRPLVRVGPGGDDAVTILKAFYLLLLGLCHLEQLDALVAPSARVTAHIVDAVDALFEGKASS
jgi:AcrR family transcriptional regulator